MHVPRSRHAGRSVTARSRRERGRHPPGCAVPTPAGAFSVAAVRAAITAEVREAAACDPEERRKRIRALQLRWHPDKNPAPLRELSTEVTKIINHALEEVEGTSGGGGAAAGAAWRGDAWRSGGASHQQAGGWRD